MENKTNFLGNPILQLHSNMYYNCIKLQHVQFRRSAMSDSLQPHGLQHARSLCPSPTPACASSSSAFHMISSAYKLNKQGDNIQPWPTPFPIWNQSVISCHVLTVASWPAYRFLKRRVRWSGIPISWRIFQFVLIYTLKDFGIVDKAVDVFLELSCFFDDPVDFGKLISGSSAFSKSSLNIWKFTIHVSLAWRTLTISLLVCAMSTIVR